jgi:hypothetical protein
MFCQLNILRAYLCLTDLGSIVYTKSGELFNATCNFLNGTSNEWYLFNDRNPLPVISFTTGPHHDIEWIYNKYQNALVQYGIRNQPVAVRCKWLSAELHMGRRIYPLEEWISSLYIVVDNYNLLLPETLIEAWSISHGHWSLDAELHIVDMDGESHVFHIEDEESDEWRALLPFPPDHVEPYVESESEAEEEESPVAAPAEETPVEPEPAPLPPSPASEPDVSEKIEAPENLNLNTD